MTQRNHNEPILAAAITGFGWLIALALPLLVCWRLLQPPSSLDDQLVMAELLIEELARDVTVLPSTDYARIAESKDHSQPGSGANLMFTDQELATLLAALRYWREEIAIHGEEAMDPYFEVAELAAFKPLPSAEVDELARRLQKLLLGA